MISAACHHFSFPAAASKSLPVPSSSAPSPRLRTAARCLPQLTAFLIRFLSESGHFTCYRQAQRLPLVHRPLTIIPPMNSAGLDFAKLKSIVIEKWRSAPELWPVKVLSIARVVQLEQRLGGRHLESVGGYFTCARAIRFKTPREMENILGFISGTFASGVSVWKLNPRCRPQNSLNSEAIHSCRAGSRSME